MGRSLLAITESIAASSIVLTSVELGCTTASFWGGIAPMSDACTMRVDAQVVLRSYYSLQPYRQTERLAAAAP